MSWAAEEFATVDVGDKRLNKRLVKVVQQWADNPSQSIPTAAGGWGDTAAAYRMLDNTHYGWRGKVTRRCQHLLGWHVQELRLGVDESQDQPRAGDAVASWGVRG